MKKYLFISMLCTCMGGYLLSSAALATMPKQPVVPKMEVNRGQLNRTKGTAQKNKDTTSMLLNNEAEKPLVISKPSNQSSVLMAQMPAKIKSQFEQYQKANRKNHIIAAKTQNVSANSTHKKDHHDSLHCFDDKKSFVGKWNIAVPQKREWLPANMATFDQDFNFVIVPTKFIVELGMFLSIEYYTPSGDVYGLIIGDGFHPTTISPNGPIVGKIDCKGKKLKLSGRLDDNFIDLNNFLWSVAGSTKSGLPLENFSLELKLDEDTLKGKTNFNPDSLNVVASCYGKRVNYNTSDKGPSVLGDPEVLIGPNTTDLSNFNFGNGWLLYVPFNGPVESWTIEPPSNPTKSAQLITTHGPWFRGFGESLFTKKKYDNYKLTLEMFMPAGGGNSGIYLRDAWEIQLGSGVPDISHNGDAVYVQNGAIYDMEPMLRTYIPIAGTDPEDDSQWNLIEITVVDQTVSLTMGGIVMQLQSIPPLGNAIATATQNAGRSFQNNPHPVGLQNHTGEVRFRNMVITPIYSLCERDVKPCKKHHK